MMSRITTTMKREFSQDDWKRTSDELTRKMQEVELKEGQIKADAAEAKASLKQMKSAVSELANQLRNGCTMVEVEAFVDYKPKAGKKRILLNAPGDSDRHMKLIREEAMTEQDYQTEMDLRTAKDSGGKEQEPAAPAAPEPPNPASN